MKIRIESNPYDRKIIFTSFDAAVGVWQNIKLINDNSLLREGESAKNFLPFKIKEILDIIVKDYYIGESPVEIVFEGTQDERVEVETICNEECYKGKIVFSTETVSKSLSNARYIFKDIKEEFEEVKPIIERLMNRDGMVISNLDKVKGALEDLIPICVFGNYSAGKSTFINALIGCEILPSGGDPVTAKVYQIANAEQPDQAIVTFEYLQKKIKLFFESDVFRMEAEDKESDLISEINEKVAACDKDDMYAKVNVALELINNYERKDKDVIVISDVIDIKVPFSKNGILGQSRNNFVIFDTPGSNSASNLNHTKVLENALARFSNGIPVWVSQYESVDSQDNAILCEKILQIQALDERFTMIIMNKADGSDLPEDGFTDKNIKEILEFNAVEKMYSSGIYFVSSVMGLGAKRNGDLTDKHYRKIFRSQRDMYEDPEDEDYATLYEYNIMPDTVKNRIVSMSEECPDKIFANSGLYGVEAAMETFASKYAAYNKCQMVYLFLNSVIGDTNKRIDEKTAFLVNQKQIREGELEQAKKDLLDIIIRESQRTVNELGIATSSALNGYVANNLHYEYPLEQLETMASSYRTDNASQNHLEIQEHDLEDNKNNMWSRFKLNGQGLFKGNVFSNVKNMASNLYSDYKDVQSVEKSKTDTEREIDKITSDMIIHSVVKEYKQNIRFANSALNQMLTKAWYDNAQALRNRLIEIITETDDLSDVERERISNTIINYQPIEFDDYSDKRFEKKKFLKGMLFGLKFNDSEKINLKLLSNKYNKWINDNIKEIANDMNNGCYGSFEIWRQGLHGIIEANITELNPNLRNIAELIQEETEKIAELASDKNKIGEALTKIEELMSWSPVN